MVRVCRTWWLVALLLLPAFAFGQAERGTLTGTITDPSGAIIPSATIVITETHTGLATTVTSSSAGYYRVPIAPGTYKIEARKEGFKTAIADNIVVPLAQVVTIDLKLEVGNVTQEVTVTSQAPLLTPSTSEVGNSISPTEFTTLPLPLDDGARQLMTFIYSSLPGAVGGSWNGSINGGQWFTTDILFDGVPLARYDLQGSIAEISPSADAVSEFRVEMSGYSAEFGNTGGGVANFGLKSGTNQFHGSLYEYVSNPVFNATGYNVNKLPEGDVSKVKPPVRENNFGGAIGGPIRKDKTFFFFDYEADYLRQARPRRYKTAPTPAMRDDADFSAFLGDQIAACGDNGDEPCFDALGRPVYSYEIYDPTSTRQVTANELDSVTGLTANSTTLIRDAFGATEANGWMPSNIIPQAYWSTASTKMLPYFPTPNLDRISNNMVVYSSHPRLNWPKWSAKIDHQINAKHRLSGSFTFSHRTRLMGRSQGYWLPLPGYPMDQTKIQEIRGRIFRASEDWTINSSTINRFSIGYNRFTNFNGQPPTDPTDYQPSVFGITGVMDTGFPQINLDRRTVGTALYQFGSYGALEFAPNGSYIVSDTLSHVRGKHSFKFGADLIRYYLNDRYTGVEQGRFNFARAETGLPGSLRNSTGHAFASFIMGAVDAGSRDVNVTTPGFRQGVLSFYAQDDWRVTPKLTFNYGIRWDIPMARTEAHDRISSFDPTLANPGADGALGALAFLGSCNGCTGRSSFNDRYWREFAPRIGFAYSATQKMVVRGGYGISYQPPIASGFPGASLGYNGSVPYGSRSLYPTLFGNSADPVLFWTGLNSTALPSGYRVGVPPFTGTLPDTAPDSQNYNSIDYWPSSLAQPYVQNWNFGIQYELPGQILIEADYVGSKGTRLLAKDLGQHYNQAPVKFMGLSKYTSTGGDDILDMDLYDALADETVCDPITLKCRGAQQPLASLGVTGPPFASFDGTVGQAILRYPQFSGITDQFPNYGSSIYHALQTTVRKRAGHGLNFIAAYTYSKTLGNTDGALYGYSGYYAPAQNYYDPGAERSIASFDYTHFLKLTWIYELPFGHGKALLANTGALDRLVSGWSITGIQQYRSGNPLQVVDTNLSGGIGNSSIRLDVVPGVAQILPWKGALDPDNGVPYLNSDAFTDPPLSDSGAYATRPGTSPRFLSSTRGPGFQSEDFGILKDTRITERFMLKFRADFFNVFNRTGRGDPVTDLSDPGSFGRVFDVMHGPRSIMLSLRLDFYPLEARRSVPHGPTDPHPAARPLAGRFFCSCSL